MRSIQLKTALAVVVLASTALGQQTMPAVQIEGAIKRLGSDDFKERVAAQQWLHDHLDIAEPAIKKMVAETTDAESKRRGTQLLQDATWGFDVDVPQGDREAIIKFSEGGGNDRARSAVLELLLRPDKAWKGTVAVKLLEADATDWERSQLMQAVSSHICTIAESYLNRGKIPELLKILEADREPHLLRHAAAIRQALREPGMTAAAIAAEEKKFSPEARFFTARARGDLDGALAIVRDGTFPEFEVFVLAEMGKWQDLATEMKRTGADEKSPATFAVVRTFAADTLMPDDLAAKLKADALAAKPEHNPENTVEALFIGGHLDDALDVLKGSRDYESTVRVLLWKRKFDDAAALVKKGLKEQAMGAPSAAVLLGRVLYERGQKTEAEALFKAAQSARPLDGNAIAELYAFYDEDRQTDAAKAVIMKALERAGPNDIDPLLQILHPEWNDFAQLEAHLWWFLLEASHPDVSIADRLAEVERISNNKIDPKDFDKRVAEAKPFKEGIRGTEGFPPDWLDKLSEHRKSLLIGEVPKDGGDDVQDDKRIAALKAMEEKAKDQLADPDKNKLAAYFDTLAAAPEMQEERPALRYMAAWAMIRAGNPAGAAAMKTALVCMAANWNSHHKVMQFLELYGDPDAAIAAQRRVIDLGNEEYGWFGAYATLSDQLRKAHRGESVQASRVMLWDMSGEHDESMSVRSVAAFSEDAGRTEMIRIENLIAAGKLDEAYARAKTARDHWMVSDDPFLNMTRAFAAVGKKKEADGLVQQLMDNELDDLKNSPDNPATLNNIAWLMARSRQDLPGAMEKAQKSLSIRPDSPETLDTVAEIYWGMGEREKAVQSEEKACALMPKDELFKRRLEHFKNDKVGEFDRLDE